MTIKVLDWESEDYAMEVIGDQLHEKTLSDVIDSVKNFNSTIQPLSNDRTTSFHVFKNQRRLFMILSRTHRISYNRLSRICTLHGYSIYMYRIGGKLEELYDTLTASITGNDSVSLNKLSSINCNFEMKSLSTGSDSKSSLSLNQDESEMIGIAATAACMPKRKFITCLMMLSLSTDTDLKNWVKEWEPDLNRLYELQEEKIKKFIRI